MVKNQEAVPLITIVVVPLAVGLLTTLLCIKALSTATVNSLDSMLHYPHRLTAAFHTGVAHNLPAPCWLTDWLLTISGSIREICKCSSRID